MPASIQPTPRSQFWGVPADLLKQAQEFGEAPFGYPNPPVKFLMELFGVPAIQRTMDKLSYGEPITNLGKANVPLLPSDTAEAAISVVPGLGAAATRVPKLAVRGLESLAASQLNAPKLAIKGASQRGAVTLGGIDDAVASHSSPALPGNIESIAQNGLYAPSIGLSRGAGNAYSPNSPSLVWRAGALDRHFPHEAPSVAYNRDAYVWNPNRGWDKPIKDQWDEYMASDTVERRLSSLMGDARLTQMLPDYHTQSAAIIASPTFKDLASWEASPFGYGALLPPDEAGKYAGKLQQYKNSMSALRAGQTGSAASGEEFLTKLARLSKADLPPELMEGNYFGESFLVSRAAPSQLGELKIYAPNVPAGPNDASIYLPKSLGGASRVNKLKDAGYQVYTPQHLAGLGGDPRIAQLGSDQMPVHLLAPSTGKAPPSADEAQRMYDDLMPPKMWTGAKMPPAPEDSFPTLDSVVPKVSFPKQGAVDADGFMVLPPKLPAVGGNSLNPAPKGLPPDFDAKFNTWLSSDTKQPEFHLEKIFGVDGQSAKQLVNAWMKSETPMKALLKKHFGVKSVPPPAKIKPLANAYNELYLAAKGKVGKADIDETDQDAVFDAASSYWEELAKEHPTDAAVVIFTKQMKELGAPPEYISDILEQLAP